MTIGAEFAKFVARDGPNTKVTEPSGAPLSSSCSVAVTEPPGLFGAVKVNWPEADGPPGTRTPWFCDPLGEPMPPVASNVALNSLWPSGRCSQ